MYKYSLHKKSIKHPAQTVIKKIGTLILMSNQTNMFLT
jgi:hypothetical protein